METPEFYEFSNSLGFISQRDKLVQRVKSLSIERGFRLNSLNGKQECRFLFTCSKSAKSYFNKKALPEDKVFCPFMMLFSKYYLDQKEFNYELNFKNYNIMQGLGQERLDNLRMARDEGLYFLLAYRPYHNHSLDLPLINSDLYLKVPEVVKPGKFQCLPREEKILHSAVKKV